MQLIAVDSQEKHDALMRELEAQGCRWSHGDLPSEYDCWRLYEERTIIYVNDDNILLYGPLERFKEEYPNTPIIDYEIKKFKEHEKVKVKQYVANYIEALRTRFDGDIDWMIRDAAIAKFTNKRPWNDTEKEVIKNEDSITLISAIRSGYEVEEEPLYRVIIPAVTNPILHQRTDSGKFVFLKEYKVFDDKYRYKFTEPEIKEFDEWYWKCAVRVGEDE